MKLVLQSLGMVVSSWDPEPLEIVAGLLTLAVGSWFLASGIPDFGAYHYLHEVMGRWFWGVLLVVLGAYRTFIISRVPLSLKSTPSFRRSMYSRQMISLISLTIWSFMFTLSLFSRADSEIPFLVVPIVLNLIVFFRLSWSLWGRGRRVRQ